MDTEATRTIVPVAGQPFRLLDLPREIRDEIYRKLLVAGHTKRYIDVNSKDYDRSGRHWYMDGPDHSYPFYTGILSANKQVHDEANDIFQRENTFVRLSLKSSRHNSLWYGKLRKCGVFRRSSHDGPVPPSTMIGMTLEIEKIDAATSQAIEYQDPYTFVCIIHVEDLPALCVFLQREIKEYKQKSLELGCRVTIHSSLKNQSLSFQDREMKLQIPASRLTVLLEPLKSIRSAGPMEIIGLGDPVLRDEIKAIMRDPLPSGGEVMKLVGHCFDQGDKASANDNPGQAVSDYKLALDTLRANEFDVFETNEWLTEGRFQGVFASQAREDANVELHARLAAMHLRCGKHRLARIYVERMTRSLHYSDDRNDPSKFPLRLTPEHNPVVYAELLAVAAEISMFNGDCGQAIGELREASRLDPGNVKWVDSLQVCEKKYDSRWKRRELEREKKRIRDEKTCHTIVQVARHRAARGQEAKRAGKLDLARDRYESAYEKIQQLQRFWGRTFEKEYDVYDCYPSERVECETLSELTIINLELHDLPQVHKYGSITTEWARLSEFIYIGYYCMAVAFQEQGDRDSAIENFEMALVYDRGCYASFYQLQALYRAKREDEAAAQAEKQRVQAAKRKEKKKRQKIAKKARAQTKAAKGSGFVVGMGLF